MGVQKIPKLQYEVVGKTAEITDLSKLVNIYLLSILTKGTNIQINLSKVVIWARWCFPKSEKYRQRSPLGGFLENFKIS